MTLEAGSIQSRFILSQDLKTVTVPPQTFCPSDSESGMEPQRFHPLRCVLPFPGVSSGCRVWEVELKTRSLMSQSAGREQCVMSVASELIHQQSRLQAKPLNGCQAPLILAFGIHPLMDNCT